MIKYIIFYIALLGDPSELNLPKPISSENQITTLLSRVFMIAAAVCVLIVAIAGLSYVLSSGDPQKAAKAKNTILYALIGLAVAIFATTIVSFVFGRLF